MTNDFNSTLNAMKDDQIIAINENSKLDTSLESVNIS